VDDHPKPEAQVRPGLADLVLKTRSVLEGLAHVLDLRRRLRLRMVLQHRDVLTEVAEQQVGQVQAEAVPDSDRD
jgi:hypothetical protein